MYSKVKLAGHPIHPILIAFPVAGYAGTLAAYAIFAANGLQFWLKVAIALNVAAVGMALLAAVPGFIDWAFGIPRDSNAKQVGLAHAVLNVCALGLFGASLGFYVVDWSTPPSIVSPVLALAVCSAGMLLTLAAGFLGWMLVQTYHVGIQLTAGQEGDEPAVQNLPPTLLPRRRDAV